MRRGLALFAVAIVLAAGSAVQAKTSAGPEEKQRYLLAQVSVTVRGWLRLEGYRQAGAPLDEARAVAVVRDTYPELSPEEARPLAFLLVMSAASEAGNEHLREVADHMMDATPDRAPLAVRKLR